MKKDVLCAISGILLVVCLAGCATTNNPEKEGATPANGNEAIEASVTSGRDDTAANRAETFKIYEQYGISYNSDKNELSYNGKLVRWFEDYYPLDENTQAGVDYFNEKGTADVYATRDFSKTNLDGNGTLTAIEKYSQQEFDEHTQANIVDNSNLGTATAGN
ncbi:MAG: hypothetical protein PHE09_14770 [Oscillospiraceae bacterium]|nr:hypothetical protein [Oscillospiraceae bacterium]